MTNSKSYTVMILIKPSRVNGLGISSGLIHDEKMNIVTDYVCQWLSVTVCKSVSKKSSRINKFLVVGGPDAGVLSISLSFWPGSCSGFVDVRSR